MKNIAAFAIILVALTACSATRLLYSFADDFIEDQAEFYLKLDEDAEAFVDDKIDEYMDWHRTKMLPRYAAFLTATADRIERAGRIDRAAIDDAVDRMRALLEATVRGFTPLAAQVLVKHTGEAETNHIGARLAERSKEQHAELDAPPESRAEERIERTQDNFERFINDLTEGQLKIIRRHVAATAGDTLRRLDRRDRNSARFIGFLKRRPSETEIHDFLDAMFLGPDAGAPAAEARFRESRFQRFQTFVADILTSTTEEQRQNLIEKLRDFAEDFRAIAS